MPGFYEVQMEARTVDPRKARRLHLPTVPTLELKVNLACYRQVAIFPTDELTVGVLDTDPDRARRAIEAERLCDKWCAHIPGFDPKEHLLEARQREVEQERKDFQLRMINLEHGLTGVERRRDRRFAWLAIGLAFGQIAAAFITAYITMTPDSIGARFFGLAKSRIEIAK